MSPQTSSGVRVGGTVERPSMINQSDKPMLGYSIQRITDSGNNAIVTAVGFHRLAAGKAIQPG